MGQIAEALRANLKAVAESDARALRDLDRELNNASMQAGAAQPAALPGQTSIKALLGRGSFSSQTVSTLKRLCKKHGITGVSRLRKAELVARLEAEGVSPPPRPLESFSKKELVSMLRTLLGEGLT
ncbi:hypothetical protein MITS9509_01795 [Synechococcus sp. MIT S9509]|uniref:SAP domain-containing protein n=1 Tax=Synechococcus sp. MIT S9509 TaxID=1801630 RepID=UPI0007BBC043|nr:SAP domain-containing protein [Synechococcus sp. MIT S9509]KZR91874.1 hypothetical protein MITS9509_01795 [Synechococcus sp. MIT S9509]